MGLEALGLWVRAGSAFNTIACLLYAGNLPIIPANKLEVLTKTDLTCCTIMLIGGIHLFIRETNTGYYSQDVDTCNSKPLFIII
jgi:hypothetical protein